MLVWETSTKMATGLLIYILNSCYLCWILKWIFPVWLIKVNLRFGREFVLIRIYCFKLESLIPDQYNSNQKLIDYRNSHLGKGMSLSYDEPIQMVRGMGAYLIDQFGRKYLDTVNNVAHVGHEHPAVVKAGQGQMALINTNTRYLHNNINLCAKELLETLPPELCVVHFVNSGSEAVELALRMAKTVTGQKDILASESGYHGNTNACVDISSYKFDGKGGSGCPEHTHIFPVPDTFRGKYKGENAAVEYAEEVKNQIELIKQNGRSPAAFIIEPIISCGGQIELPEGFLSRSYNLQEKRVAYAFPMKFRWVAAGLENPSGAFNFMALFLISLPLGNLWVTGTLLPL